MIRRERAGSSRPWYSVEFTGRNKSAAAAAAAAAVVLATNGVGTGRSSLARVIMSIDFSGAEREECTSMYSKRARFCRVIKARAYVCVSNVYSGTGSSSSVLGTTHNPTLYYIYFIYWK